MWERYPQPSPSPKVLFQSDPRASSQIVLAGFAKNARPCDGCPTPCLNVLCAPVQWDLGVLTGLVCHLYLLEVIWSSSV